MTAFSSVLCSYIFIALGHCIPHQITHNTFLESLATLACSSSSLGALAKATYGGARHYLLPIHFSPREIWLRPQPLLVLPDNGGHRQTFEERLRWLNRGV